jgi:hypothetical protein
MNETQEYSLADIEIRCSLQYESKLISFNSI